MTREQHPWIVCFGGEDWWYHSHAHFDIQVMKQLAQRTRVLYVCSIGMRMPSIRADSLFLTRIRRKLLSVSKTLRRMNSTLYVYSPLPFPLYGARWSRSINHAFLAAQLRTVFFRLRIRQPLFYINTPTGWPVAQHFGRSGVVYQRTDDYAAYDFDNFNAEYIRRIDLQLVREADLVIHVSEELHAEALTLTRNSLLLEQGVDERFFEPAIDESVPSDMAAIPRPLIGYVGAMESHKFDTHIVREAARQLPDCSFVLVGPYDDNVASLRSLANVHFLGSKTHDAIPDYVRSFDICMLPTAKTEWGMKCKPIKLMEYLAAERPVVSTTTPAAMKFGEYVRVADCGVTWANAIRDLLSNNGKPQRSAREHVKQYTWRRHSDHIWEHLEERRLVSLSSEVRGTRAELSAPDA